jgi:hypothetical protein
MKTKNHVLLYINVSTSLTPPHLFARPNPVDWFPTGNVVIYFFFVFFYLMWRVIAYFVYIDRIFYYHCLNITNVDF